MNLEQVFVVLGCGLSIVGIPLLAALLARARREIHELQDAVFVARVASDPAARIVGPVSDSQLQQSVDAIAVELERVSEGQRFVTKLLAERPKNPIQQSPIPGTRSQE